MAEADRVNNGVVAAAVILTGSLLIVLVFGVATVFDFAMRDEIERKVNAIESTLLRQQRVDEQRKTSTYQWVDAKHGIVRIPIERAVELIVSEGYRRPPPPPPPPVPAPAPTPGVGTPAAGAAPAGATGTAPAVPPAAPAAPAPGPAVAPAAPAPSVAPGGAR